MSVFGRLALHRKARKPSICHIWQVGHGKDTYCKAKELLASLVLHQIVWSCAHFDQAEVSELRTSAAQLLYNWISMSRSAPIIRFGAEIPLMSFHTQVGKASAKRRRVLR